MSQHKIAIEMATRLDEKCEKLYEQANFAEALEACEQASEIWRKLTQEDAPTYAPDLAVALGAQGSILRHLAREDEAALVFLEGLEVIAPLLDEQIEHLGELAQALFEDFSDVAIEADFDEAREQKVLEALLEAKLIEETQPTEIEENQA